MHRKKQNGRKVEGTLKKQLREFDLFNAKNSQGQIRADFFGNCVYLVYLNIIFCFAA